jgi:hypothetical protein
LASQATALDECESAIVIKPRKLLVGQQQRLLTDSQPDGFESEEPASWEPKDASGTSGASRALAHFVNVCTALQSLLTLGSHHLFATGQARK